MTTASNSTPAEARSCIALDPCTLGRPFHLLDEFHATLRRRIGAYLQDRYNYRCGACLTVSDSIIVPHRTNDDPAVWHGFGSESDTIGVRIERSLLVLLLAYHYGDRPDRISPDKLPPESRTEQRFAMQARRALLGELLPLFATDVATFAPRPFDGVVPGSRILSVIVRDELLDVTGRLEFAMDEAWLARLFAAISPQRSPERAPTADDELLGARIPVSLNATVMSKELPLGDVLRLECGSVVPIRLPDVAEVDVDGTRIFCAAVVEHGGKICLTALEFVE